ncbi:hypothetical protein [Dermacoccus nishinomiyaensis]|nr:hypothetical protein [Dermacoccus nishinomiyaensis]
MTVMALVAADAALTVAQPSMKELEGIEEFGVSEGVLVAWQRRAD